MTRKCLGNRAESTLKRYRPELERFWEFARRDGVTSLDRVSVALVDRLRAERAATVSARTLHHETVVVKQLVNYADAGVPAAQLMQWAGHKDMKTSLECYHATDEPSQRAMDAVSSEADTPSDEPDSKRGQ